MKVFVFLSRNDSEPRYNLGLLREDDSLEELKEFQNLSSTELRGVLNNIDCDCIFVGKNLRVKVLAPLYHELTMLRTDLPERLKFHWVPPYQLPFDDVAWMFDFGMFTEETQNKSIFDLANSLLIDFEMHTEIWTLATVYFSLVGDFHRLNKNN